MFFPTILNNKKLHKIKLNNIDNKDTIGLIVKKLKNNKLIILMGIKIVIKKKGIF